MDTGTRLGRKHPSSESSDEHPDAPKTKKKKKLPSTEKLPVNAEPPTSSKSRTTASGSQKPSISASQKPSTSTQGDSGSTVADSSSQGAKKIVRKTKSFLKPQRGSWLNHIAQTVVHQCVNKAISHSIDPRKHFKDINWKVMSEGLLTSDVTKMFWYYIKKEYPEVPLTEVLTMTKPYAKLTTDHFTMEDIRLKYKDQVPKPPVSAYLLFHKAKGPKLKEKHPELSTTEMAVKLGKKWRSMEAEKRDKYKQQYIALKAVYKAEMMQFYEEHPDARPAPAPKKVKSGSQKQTASGLSEQDAKRLRELKLLVPKPPMPPYLAFCKAKRQKLQQKHPELNSKQITQKLGDRWKSLGEEGQAKYKRPHEQSMEEHKKTMEEFNLQYPDYMKLLLSDRSTKQMRRKIAELEKKQEALLQRLRDEEAVSPLIIHPKEEHASEEDEESEGELQVDLTPDGTSEKNACTESNSEDSSESSDDD